MRMLLALMLFLLPIFPAKADDGARGPDKITTLNRMIDEPTEPPDCAGDVCTHRLYHYEIDEHGRLYFVRLTATGARGESVLHPGAATFSFICQLNSLLLCEMPELHDQPYDLSAYSIDEEGVKVHSALSPWENPQRAAVFLAVIKSAQNIASETHQNSQSRMMDDLVCYVFDFGALAAEYKKYGRIVEDSSMRKLEPGACLASFKTICADPGSRADEAKLASDARTGGPDGPKKFKLTAADINHFCRSLKEMKSAMLR